MSMGTAPASGYTLELSDIDNIDSIIFTDEEIQQAWEKAEMKFSEFVNTDSLSDFEDVSVKFNVNGQNVTCELMYYDEDSGDSYDELPVSGYYLLFEEDQLYKKSHTKTGVALSKAGIFPRSTQWTVFG